ncbi:MAG: PAS domain S-box protein, partial [Desulfatitalea sp.]|nr:PAS domain S-box protein [Desulfatitalea sp.]
MPKPTDKTLPDKIEKGYRAVKESLRQSEERYRSILEKIQDAYYEVDLKGRLTYFNDAICNLHG